MKFIILMLLSFSVSAQTIQLSWDAPTEREDGSSIESIDNFNIYQSFENATSTLIEVDASLSTYEILDAAYGSYTFQISTVEAGQEGEKSDPLTVTVYAPTISPPQKITISGNNLMIEVIE